MLHELPEELEAKVLELVRQINENEARMYWKSITSSLPFRCGNRLIIELNTFLYGHKYSTQSFSVYIKIWKHWFPIPGKKR